MSARTVRLPPHLVTEESVVRRVHSAAGEYDARSVRHHLAQEVADWLAEKGINYRHRQRSIVFFRDQDAEMFRQRFWGQVIQFRPRPLPEQEAGGDDQVPTPSPR